MNTTDYDKYAKTWKTTPKLESVIPTCIYNVVSTLVKHPNCIYDPKLTFPQISNEIMCERDTGCSWYEAISGMTKLFREGKNKEFTQITVNSIDGRCVKIQEMSDILSENMSSFPIALMGPKYLQKVRDISPRRNLLDRGIEMPVVVLNITDSHIIIFDPYDPYPEIGGESPVRRLNRNKYQNYWLTSQTSNSLLWFTLSVLPLYTWGLKNE